MKIPDLTSIPWKIIGVVIGAVVFIAVMVAAIRSCERQEDKENANLVNQGAVIERSTQQSETINAVQNANDARDNPTSDELNRVCSQYDRNCAKHP